MKTKSKLTASKQITPKPRTRQSIWRTTNRARGLCFCGRKPWRIGKSPTRRARKYAQCIRCILQQRARIKYKGDKGRGGGRPPGSGVKKFEIPKGAKQRRKKEAA